MSTPHQPITSAVSTNQSATLETKPPATSPDDFEKRRAEFLQKMYAQMFDDIKVQLQVVWQAVAVVAGTFGLFALVDKGVIPLDVATSVIILIASWLIAHVLEASYWYNRNLVIIANIERQFLKQQDLRDIHYYFGKHRKVGAMIYHLRIQFLFGLCIAVVVLFYHFSIRVLPAICEPWSNLELNRALPYIVAALAVVTLYYHRNQKAEAYKAFLRNSPGKDIETNEIDYAHGHPGHDEHSKNTQGA
jgi:hypothetical protein